MTLYFEKLNLCVHSIHASVYIFVCVRMCVWWFPDEFEKYCGDVEHTAAWGGQLEVSCSSFVTDSLYWCPFYFSIILFFFVSLSVASFDPGSSFADRSDPGRLRNYKNWGGI